jgi:hypothetical protein
MNNPTYVWLITYQRGAPFLDGGHVHVTRHTGDASGELVARASMDRLRLLSRRMGWENRLAVARAPGLSEALAKAPMLAPDGATVSAADIETLGDLSPIDEQPLGGSLLLEWRAERERS